MHFLKTKEMKYSFTYIMNIGDILCDKISILFSSNYDFIYVEKTGKSVQSSCCGMHFSWWSVFCT